MSGIRSYNIDTIFGRSNEESKSVIQLSYWLSKKLVISITSAFSLEKQ